MEVYDLPTLSRKECIRGCILWMLVWCLAALLFYNRVWPGAAGLFLIPLFLRELRRKKGERNRQVLRSQFRDFLYSVSSSAAAGKSLRSALCSAAEAMAMIHPAEAPICRESRRLARALQETMQSEEEVLEEWATRSGLDEIRLFSQTCSICRRTGGNLEQALAKANRILTSRIEAENGVQSLLKQKRLEVCILLAVPLCLLFLLQTASPEYMEDLYETGNGRILMTAALAALIGAYIWSESMIRKIFFTEKPSFHIRIPFGKKVKA